MLRLLVAINLLIGAAPATVPGTRVMTPGGDRLGYAPVPLPYRGVHRLTGVLFAHDPVAGTDLTCGASVIRSKSRSLVLTAAHCINHGGRPLRRISFVPGFEAGRARLGVWPAVRTWVPKRWGARPYSAAQLPYDIGLVGVAKAGVAEKGGVARRGRPLEAVTGPGLRPAPSPRGRTLRGLELLGYPIGSRYTGMEMYRCLGDAVDGGAGGPGVLVTRNCQAAAGSSGGPAVSGGAVHGVVSSSSPLRDPAGFTVLTRLNREPFGHLLRRADRAMQRANGVTHRRR